MTDLIAELIDEIGPGHMGSTAYDTAWTARLGEIDFGRQQHERDHAEAVRHRVSFR